MHLVMVLPFPFSCQFHLDAHRFSCYSSAERAYHGPPLYCPHHHYNIPAEFLPTCLRHINLVKLATPLQMHGTVVQDTICTGAAFAADRKPDQSHDSAILMICPDDHHTTPCSNAAMPAVFNNATKEVMRQHHSLHHFHSLPHLRGCWKLLLRASPDPAPLQLIAHQSLPGVSIEGDGLYG